MGKGQDKAFSLTRQKIGPKQHKDAWACVMDCVMERVKTVSPQPIPILYRFLVTWPHASLCPQEYGKPVKEKFSIRTILFLFMLLLIVHSLPAIG